MLAHNVQGENCPPILCCATKCGNKVLISNVEIIRQFESGIGKNSLFYLFTLFCFFNLGNSQKGP